MSSALCVGVKPLTFARSGSRQQRNECSLNVNQRSDDVCPAAGLAKTARLYFGSFFVALLVLFSGNKWSLDGLGRPYNTTDCNGNISLLRQSHFTSAAARVSPIHFAAADLTYNRPPTYDYSQTNPSPAAQSIICPPEHIVAGISYDFLTDTLAVDTTVADNGCYFVDFLLDSGAGSNVLEGDLCTERYPLVGLKTVVDVTSPSGLKNVPVCAKTPRTRCYDVAGMPWKSSKRQMVCSGFPTAPKCRSYPSVNGGVGLSNHIFNNEILVVTSSMFEITAFPSIPDEPDPALRLAEPAVSFGYINCSQCTFMVGPNVNIDMPLADYDDPADFPLIAEALECPAGTALRAHWRNGSSICDALPPDNQGVADVSIFLDTVAPEDVRTIDLHCPSHQLMKALRFEDPYRGSSQQFNCFCTALPFLSSVIEHGAPSFDHTLHSPYFPICEAGFFLTRIGYGGLSTCGSFGPSRDYLKFDCTQSGPNTTCDASDPYFPILKATGGFCEKSTFLIGGILSPIGLPADFDHVFLPNLPPPTPTEPFALAATCDNSTLPPDLDPWSNPTSGPWTLVDSRVDGVCHDGIAVAFLNGSRVLCLSIENYKSALATKASSTTPGSGGPFTFSNIASLSYLEVVEDYAAPAEDDPNSPGRDKLVCGQSKRFDSQKKLFVSNPADFTPRHTFLGGVRIASPQSSTPDQWLHVCNTYGYKVAWIDVANCPPANACLMYPLQQQRIFKPSGPPGSYVFEGGLSFTCAKNEGSPFLEWQRSHYPVNITQDTAGSELVFATTIQHCPPAFCLNANGGCTALVDTYITETRDAVVEFPSKPIPTDPAAEPPRLLTRRGVLDPSTFLPIAEAFSYATKLDFSAASRTPRSIVCPDNYFVNGEANCVRFPYDPAVMDPDGLSPQGIKYDPLTVKWVLECASTDIAVAIQRNLLGCVRFPGANNLIKYTSNRYLRSFGPSPCNTNREAIFKLAYSMNPSVNGLTCREFYYDGIDSFVETNATTDTTTALASSSAASDSTTASATTSGTIPTTEPENADDASDLLIPTLPLPNPPETGAPNVLTDNEGLTISPTFAPLNPYEYEEFSPDYSFRQLFTRNTIFVRFTMLTSLEEATALRRDIIQAFATVLEVRKSSIFIVDMQVGSAIVTVEIRNASSLYNLTIDKVREKVVIAIDTPSSPLNVLHIIRDNLVVAYEMLGESAVKFIKLLSGDYGTTSMVVTAVILSIVLLLIATLTICCCLPQCYLYKYRPCKADYPNDGAIDDEYSRDGADHGKTDDESGDHDSGSAINRNPLQPNSRRRRRGDTSEGRSNSAGINVQSSSQHHHHHHVIGLEDDASSYFDGTEKSEKASSYYTEEDEVGVVEDLLDDYFRGGARGPHDENGRVLSSADGTGRDTTNRNRRNNRRGVSSGSDNGHRARQRDNSSRQNRDGDSRVRSRSQNADNTNNSNVFRTTVGDGGRNRRSNSTHNDNNDRSTARRREEMALFLASESSRTRGWAVGGEARSVGQNPRTDPSPPQQLAEGHTRREDTVANAAPFLRADGAVATTRGVANEPTTYSDQRELRTINLLSPSNIAHSAHNNNNNEEDEGPLETLVAANGHPTRLVSPTETPNMRHTEIRGDRPLVNDLNNVVVEYDHEFTVGANGSPAGRSNSNSGGRGGVESDDELSAAKENESKEDEEREQGHNTNSNFNNDMNVIGIDRLGLQTRQRNMPLTGLFESVMDENRTRPRVIPPAVASSPLVGGDNPLDTKINGRNNAAGHGRDAKKEEELTNIEERIRRAEQPSKPRRRIEPVSNDYERRASLRAVVIDNGFDIVDLETREDNEGLRSHNCRTRAPANATLSSAAASPHATVRIEHGAPRLVNKEAEAVRRLLHEGNQHVPQPLQLPDTEDDEDEEEGEDEEDQLGECTDDEEDEERGHYMYSSRVNRRGTREAVGRLNGNDADVDYYSSSSSDDENDDSCDSEADDVRFFAANENEARNHEEGPNGADHNHASPSARVRAFDSEDDEDG